MKVLKNINDMLLYFIRITPDNELGTILAVSSTGFGDTVLSTPAIKTLKKSFPKNKLLFLVNKKYSKLFVGYEYVDKIILYTGGYINLFSVILKCRFNKVNTVFLFHANGPEDVFISILSGANNILKWTDNINHEYRQLFINAPNAKKQHHIEKKIDLVRRFGPGVIDTRMEVSNNYDMECNSLIPEISEEKIIGVQLGAQDVYKIWPTENILQLCRKLINGGYHIVLFGATKFESRMAKRIMNSLGCNNDCVTDLCCRTDIDDLPCLLQRLSLLVTNDTGILHLAIALSVRTLSLFGPTSVKEFGAYQDYDNHYYIQKDGSFVNDQPKKQRSQDGMKLITVSEVYNKIIEIS